MGEAKAKVKDVPVEKARELYNLAFRTSRTTISVIDAMTQRGAIKGEELSLRLVNCETSASKCHNLLRPSSLSMAPTRITTCDVLA